jgi:pimeloyl-ACP methyl ester carboxylesterase
MPYTYSGACALYYEHRGTSGSPLLLIAGYGSSLAGWPRVLIEQLSEQHRVILFDNRGSGNSGKPDAPYVMDEFADDAAAILDAMDVGSAHVMGVSMGGMIAQNFALRHPERMRGLVLGCTAPAALDSDEVVAPEQAVMETLLAPRCGDPAQDIRNLWPIVHSARYIDEARDLLEQKLVDTEAYPKSPQYALERQMQAIAETHNVLGRLCELVAPTLVLAGTDDVLVPPQNSRVIADRIPHAHLIEYEGVGHDFLDEAGARAAADILRFLADVDSAFAVAPPA